MAILAGDGLLNYAYETAAKAVSQAGPWELEKVAQALCVLAANPEFTE